MKTGLFLAVTKELMCACVTCSYSSTDTNPAPGTLFKKRRCFVFFVTGNLRNMKNVGGKSTQLGAINSTPVAVSYRRQSTDWQVYFIC